MASLTNTPAWQALQAHSAQFKHAQFRLAQLYASTPGRFDKFSVRHENLLLDFSKNFITDETLDLLIELALQQQLPAAIAAMFSGETINVSEQRQALHVALREPAASSKLPEVEHTLQQMEALVSALHHGTWLGYSGKPITDVVNLGVGGSDLGPALAVSALKHTMPVSLRCHFVSNIDPVQIASKLHSLNPETTLFVVASKSFTTLETLHNAQVARDWLLATASDDAIAKHFIGVTSNTDAALSFGIDDANILPLWDWVGGRFSLWSAIGLPIALTLGMQEFRQLLAGAHAMDEHFRHAPLRQNLPAILALLGIWYRGFFDAHSTAIVPYSQALELLPDYLQQLSMESLGKSVDQSGQPLDIDTGEPVWGVLGTDGQHSCFQMLHQGTNFIPVDFIVPARPTSTGDSAAHNQLLANCFSQSQALMQGHRDDNTPAWRTIAGNKPSNTLMLSAINPYNLGSLIALYEHKIYVQSVIWNINAFDQWGVELGKQLSQQIYATMTDTKHISSLDESTQKLIDNANKWNS